MKANSKSLTKILLAFLLILILVGFSLANATTIFKVIKVIKVGRVPDDVLVNPITNKIYTLNFHSMDFSVIDGNIDKVIDTIKPGKNFHPRIYGVSAINSNTNRIYVHSDNPPLIDVIDLTAKQSIATILHPTVGDGIKKSIPAIDDIVVNPNTNKIYFLAFDNLGKIDGQTNSVSYIAKFPEDSFAKYLAINPDTNRIYVPTFEEKVFVIDALSEKIVSEIQLSEGNLRRIAVNNKTNKIYLLASTSNVDRSAGAVVVIDGNTNNIIKEIPLRDPLDLSINSNTNTIYVSSNNEYITRWPFAYIIDGNTDTIQKSLKSRIRSLATDVEVNPQTNKAYFVLGTDEDKVVVVGE